MRPENPHENLMRSASYSVSSISTAVPAGTAGSTLVLRTLGVEGVPDRATVFIDGGYFDKALAGLGRLRVDYQKFSDKVCEGTERLRTYYYHCMPYQSNPPTEDERIRYSSMDRFLYTLRMLSRFEVRLGRLQYVNAEFRQKGVDVLLSIDLVELAATGQITKAVLVTGDSDFAHAARRARDKGVLVQLYYSPATYVHDELLQSCDDRIPLDLAFFKDLLRT